MTPEAIRVEIQSLVAELAKAPDWVSRYELESERASLDYERAYDLAFLEADGNVEERKAYARQAAAELRDAAAVAHAAFTRVKTKTRQLEQSIVACQALLKSIQLEGA